MANQRELSERIVSDPGIYGGKPIVRGTRMPVHLIAGFLELGMTPEQIVDDYPDLTIEDVLAVSFIRDDLASTTSAGAR